MLIPHVNTQVCMYTKNIYMYSCFRYVRLESVQKTPDSSALMVLLPLLQRAAAAAGNPYLFYSSLKTLNNKSYSSSADSRINLGRYQQNFGFA